MIIIIIIIIIIIDEKNNENGRARRKTIRKAVIEMKGLNAENKDDTLFFHKITDKENSILFLSTKLLILLLVACISSFLVFILWIHINESAYVIDACVNIYCIWLCFHSTTKIFWNICLGKYCVKFSFPYIKMYALTCCNDCYSANSPLFVIDENKILDNQFGGCCNKTTIKERKRVLDLARKEYPMVVEKHFQY